VDHLRVITGALQPVIVPTDMIMDCYQDQADDFKSDQKILSMIANPVDTVAVWMADKILHNQKNGANYNFSNTL